MLSIVIPIYNTEKYIRECLDSLLKEKVSIEIIIVNDGSTDDSYLHIKDYLKYDNIKYFYQENSGVSKARNFGILQATGDYIMFLDSDDLIKEGSLKLISEKIEKYDPDCVIYGHRKFYGHKKFNTHNTISIERLNFLEEDKIYNSNEILKYVFNLKIRGYVCDKIFRRSIWVDNNIKFDNKKYCEDWYPTTLCIEQSGKIIAIKDDIHCYRQHEDSAMHTKDMELVVGYSEAVHDILNRFETKVSNESIYSFKGNTFGEIISGYDENYKGSSIYKDFKKEGFLNIKFNEIMPILLNSEVSMRNKIALILWKLRIYRLIKKVVWKK